MSRTPVRGAPMFQSRLAKEKWDELNDAIDEAPVRIPCRESDPDAWFPSEENPKGGWRYQAPKKLCQKCPVQNLCLEFALINDEIDGLWGGMTPKERKQLRRRR